MLLTVCVFQTHTVRNRVKDPERKDRLNDERSMQKHYQTGSSVEKRGSEFHREFHMCSMVTLVNVRVDKAKPGTAD